MRDPNASIGTWPTNMMVPTSPVKAVELDDEKAVELCELEESVTPVEDEDEDEEDELTVLLEVSSFDDELSVELLLVEVDDEVSFVEAVLDALGGGFATELTPCDELEARDETELDGRAELSGPTDEDELDDALDRLGLAGLLLETSKDELDETTDDADEMLLVGLLGALVGGGVEVPSPAPEPPQLINSNVIRPMARGWYMLRIMV